MEKKILKGALSLIIDIIDERYDWMIPIMKAYISGEDIEYYDANYNKWEAARSPTFSTKLKYRIKPKNEYIPFTYKSILKHRDCWIESKNYMFTAKIQYADSKGIVILLSTSTQHITYEDLLKDFTFENGDVCGIKNI